MFSIYRRFDGDIRPNGGRGQDERNTPQKPLVGQGENKPMASPSPHCWLARANQHGQGSPASQTKGQIFGNATVQNQRHGPEKLRNPYLSGQQKALPPSCEHREEQSRKSHQPQRSSQKKSGFLQGFLPTGLYDSKSKKLFGFLATEDLLLVALIFLLLEKDGEDNTLMILALAYVLLSDYIDLPELGF